MAAIITADRKPRLPDQLQGHMRMRKLLNGIIEFRKTMRPDFQSTFAKLALGQSPDALFIGCSDSRVVPDVFASTDPGDLFVIRNVGNMIPACTPDSLSDGDAAEAAAIEYALGKLKVDDIIVCGHSECGAMQAVAGGIEHVEGGQLKAWLANGTTALDRLERGEAFDPGLSRHNCLSQLNVMEQIAHLMTYPIVRERVQQGKVSLHGWWFDIANADVHMYDVQLNRFVVVDANTVKRWS